jgi:glycerophosphoryl diester phosphodiesterase
VSVAVDEAFDTKPPVVSAPTTFLMPEDDIEMTLYEGDYPSMNIRSEAAAVKPALLTTPPKPRLIKPVPRRMQYVDDSAKDASVDQKASSSQQDTIKDEELVKVLRDNGMKVHYLDFANISPSKRIRRHYWVTPASNEPETGNVLWVICDHTAIIFWLTAFVFSQPVQVDRRHSCRIAQA